MGETSKIGWTGSTWNPWIGCHRASPGCENCYMERWAKRAGRDPHRVTKSSASTFNLPLKLQRKVDRGELEVGHTVFVCSLSDFFHVDADEWRDEAWEMIRRCPGLTFQILTKRADRIADHMPEGWGLDGWRNVWLGVSVESGRFLSRVNELAKVPAEIRFISMEPLIGPVGLESLREALLRVDWVIVGGESGSMMRTRIFDLDEAKKIALAAMRLRVPFFFKQVGVKTRLDSGEVVTRRSGLDKDIPAGFPRQLPAPRFERIADAKALARELYLSLCGISPRPLEETARKLLDRHTPGFVVSSMSDMVYEERPAVIRFDCKEYVVDPADDVGEGVYRNSEGSDVIDIEVLVAQSVAKAKWGPDGDCDAERLLELMKEEL